MSESTIQPKAGVCSCFRTRMMFLPEQGQQSTPHTYGFELSDVGHSWCQKTLRVMGPDDGLVAEEKCGPARSCFRDF
jgi:hypothetical protein